MVYFPSMYQVNLLTSNLCRPINSNFVARPIEGFGFPQICDPNPFKMERTLRYMFFHDRSAFTYFVMFTMPTDYHKFFFQVHWRTFRTWSARHTLHSTATRASQNSEKWRLGKFAAPWWAAFQTACVIASTKNAFLPVRSTYSKIQSAYVHTSYIRLGL